MKRIVYYVIQATADENERGLFHYSPPFNDIEKAKESARKIQNDFVGVEMHNEYFVPGNKPEFQWMVEGDVKQIDI